MNPKLRTVVIAARNDVNVAAFLRVIREKESSNDERAWKMRFGGLGKPIAYFQSFADHPRVLEPTYDGKQSSAAGAFQITMTSYDEIKADLGEDYVPDFTPESQTRVAIGLMAKRGILPLVLAGRFEEAVVAARPTWTSLPGASESSSKWTMALARKIYDAYGGRLAPQAQMEDVSTQYAANEAQQTKAAEIPVQENDMPAPLVAAAISMAPMLFQTLLQIFQPLAKQKVEKELARHTDDPAVASAMAESVMEVVQKLTGKDNQVAATATAMTDPAVMAQVEEASIAWLEKMAPMLDKIAEHDKVVWEAEENSHNAAAARASSSPADDWMAKTLVIGILLICAFLILLVSGVAITQVALLEERSPTTEVWAALTGIIGTTLGILGTVYAFRFGTTKINSIKDITVEQLSRRK